MTPAQLSRTVLHAVRRSFESGRLCAAPGSVELPERLVVESPPRRGDGDYGVSVAFQVAKAAGTSPYDVAQVLRSELEGQDGVRSVEVAGAGFLNVTLDDRARAALVAELAVPDDDESDHQPVDPEPDDHQQRGRQPHNHQPRRDEPAADIARWSAATGDAPASLAVRTTQSSPLFHVQYAYARTRALSRNAHDLGFRSDPHAGNGAGTTGGSPYGTRARALLALLADHRRVSEQGDSGRQARHLVAVGDAFFDFHDNCPPLPSGDEKPGAAHRARLALVEATGAVLAGGLSQLGVTAPAHL